MKIEATTSPNQEDLNFVASQVREHNAQLMVMGFSSVAAFLRNDEGKIVGGVTGKAYWGWLHVDFLWVARDIRGVGYGSSIMRSAEAEAKKLGCKYSMLDTFSFQAKAFYEKLGYEVFGRLEGYTNQHERYYLRKTL